ncbi:hypothetical protein BaRGS_00028771, partial [Batillaria attramentaria]
IVILSAKSSVKELLLLVILVLTFVVMFGSLAYVTEFVTEDFTFSSIPHGMWWAIVTMTTVGYGDVSPVGVYGQLVGAVCTLTGVIVLALPIAVIASKFSTYHDNLNPRQQLRARLAFLQENPQFLNKDSRDVVAVTNGCDKDEKPVDNINKPTNRVVGKSERDRVPTAKAWDSNSRPVTEQSGDQRAEKESRNHLNDKAKDAGKPHVQNKNNSDVPSGVQPSTLGRNRARVKTNELTSSMSLHVLKKHEFLEPWSPGKAKNRAGLQGIQVCLSGDSVTIHSISQSHDSRYSQRSSALAVDTTLASDVTRQHTLPLDPRHITVEIDVGGKLFKTKGDTLCTFPQTRLGKVVDDASQAGLANVSVFFDRTPRIFCSVLDFYRTGELHLPKRVCGAVVERELKFWNIPTEMIADCCWKDVRAYRKDCRITHEIDHFLSKVEESQDEGSSGGLHRTRFSLQVWTVMEHKSASTIGRAWTITYFSVVMLSALLYALETSFEFRECRDQYSYLGNNLTQLAVTQRYIATRPVKWLRDMLTISFSFFTVEIIFRMITAPRFRTFMRKCRNVFDLFLVVHNAVVILAEETIAPDLNSTTLIDYLVAFYRMALLRVLRVFYISRSFDGMRVLLLSARASMREMMLLIVCVLSFVIMFGSLAYVVELLAHSFVFHDVPHAMWWAIVTMTTVGYGEVVPGSVMGKIVGALCALVGVLVLALPVAVIAESFSSYFVNMAAHKQMINRGNFLAKHPEFRIIRRRHALATRKEKAFRMGSQGIEYVYKAPSFVNSPQSSSSLFGRREFRTSEDVSNIQHRASQVIPLLHEFDHTGEIASSAHSIGTIDGRTRERTDSGHLFLSPVRLANKSTSK